MQPIKKIILALGTLLLSGGWTWNNDAGTMTVVVSPNWENAGRAVIATGTSSQNPSSVGGSCADSTLAHLSIGTAYPCTLSGAGVGGWCRDVYVGVHINTVGVETSCTVTMPGTTKSIWVLATDGTPDF